ASTEQRHRRDSLETGKRAGRRAMDPCKRVVSIGVFVVAWCGAVLAACRAEGDSPEAIGAAASAALVPTTGAHTSAPGTAHEVGPGRPFPSLGAVPWESLGPGDSVRIHWRATPYREKVLLSNRGTATDPIVVCGVADGPNGEPPVIDGRGATTRPQTRFGLV